MIEFQAQVLNGTLRFPKVQEELRMRLLSESEGKWFTERLFRGGPHKTSNQVRAHWGLAVALIRERMIELGWSVCGVAPNKDMIHEILLKTCGGVGPLGASLRLSEMTIEQAMKFFENIRDWAATQLHLVIPDPDKNYKKNRPGRERNSPTDGTLI